MHVNLVLSGGGARCLAHLGIIKVLLETGYSIKQISGVSAGAVMGAFIAAGYKPEEILKIFLDNNLMFQVRPAFNGGLFKMNKWEKILLDYFPENSFEALKIPLIINATDINSCKTVRFSSGELALPLLASCTVPGIFEPISINNCTLVDGGVLDNLPVEPFISDTSKIFASHVNPVISDNNIESAFKIIERCVLLSIREKMEKNGKYIHFLFEPPELARYAIFDFDSGEEIYNIGYTYASDMREKFEKLSA